MNRGPRLPMYVWVGSQAHENEILHAIKRGKVNGEIHSKLKIDLQWCKFFWICLNIFPCNPSFFLKTFCQHKQYPEVIPICRIADDSEPNDFKKNFYDWREKDTKHRQLTKLYSIGNIGTRCMLYDLLEKIWFYYIIFTDGVCMIDMKKGFKIKDSKFWSMLNNFCLFEIFLGTLKEWIKPLQNSSYRC